MTELNGGQNIGNVKNIEINPIFIDNNVSFKDQIPFLEINKKLGIDIEYPAMTRYSDRVSLIQIGTNEKQLLIDTEIFYPKALIPILESKNIEKIFFDASQDIMMIKDYFNCEINKISDVSHYYTIVNNLKNNIGLDKVINHYFGNVINRETKNKFQKIDWRERPISREAQHYAASDVAYLIPIRDYLVNQIEMKGFSQHLDRLSKSYELIKPIDWNVSKFFFKFKYSGKYTNPIDKLLALRIHIIRDEIAENWNKPFFFVLGKEKFELIVKQKPVKIEDLIKIFSKNQIKNSKLVNSILKIVQNTISDIENNPLIFYYEYEQYKNALKIIGHKNADIVNLNEILLTVMGNKDIYREYYKKINILKKWRDYKSKILGIHKDLLLSENSLKLLCKIDLDITYPIEIPGINQKFWTDYDKELLFWLDNRNIELKAIKD
jgi:ribonuclease D